MLREMKVWLSLLLLAPLTVHRAAGWETNYAALGRLIVTQFVSAPFPHPARAAGHTYRQKLYSAGDHYSDSTVAIFVPNGFRATAHVDLVVHFHGWNNTVSGTVAGFRLIEQFVASRRNAVLVVPEGPRNAPDSFGGKLEGPDGFHNFVKELLHSLQHSAGFATNLAAGQIILSGHSGGYRVISAILDRGGLSANVKEVWLFDALYAETDKFLKWWDRHSGRLINIYTDGGGTKDDSEAMMDLLKKRGTQFFAGEETATPASALATNQLIFLHTDLGHNEVVAKRNQFQLYLQTSVLAELNARP